METSIAADGCPDENALLALLHRQLPEAEQARVERHLDGCSDCRRICAALLKGAPAESAEEATVPRVTEGLDRPPLAPSTRVGRYVVMEKLGQGGMGVVYVAHDPHLDRRVSLKLILGAGEKDVAESHARLQREAQALARLSHPNVVAVHDLGVWEGQVYLVMDLVRGRTLRHWLQEAQRPWREIVRVFLEAGSGLAAAHRAGLIHRDFKPSNVLVDEEGHARVLDFGLARIADGPPSPGAPEAPPLPDEEEESPPTSPSALSEAITRTGQVLGTPLYMAPEQHRGGTLDERTDQFSFAVALYEALFGVRPYLARDLREHALRGKTPVLRPGSSGGDVPPKLRQAVLRALSLEPPARYAFMDELLVALRASLVRPARIAAVAAVALASGLLAGGGAMLVARGRSCEGAGDAFAAGWGPEQRARVRAAFAGTGAPHSAGAAERVEKQLDAYASEWGAAAVDACAAARSAGSPGRELWERRKACLEHLRMNASSLVDVLAHTDREALDQAVQAAYGLRRISACASPPARLAPAPAGTEALRERASMARALWVAGRVLQGLAVAEPLAKDAAASGSRAVEAEALELLGVLRRAHGDAKGSEDALFRAITAAQAAGDDPGAARVMAQLAKDVGKGERAGEGRRWMELASAVVEREGSDPDLEAQVLDARAWIDYDERKIEDALASAKHVVELRERTLPPDHPDVARGYLTYGTMLNGSGHPARAEGAYRKALPILQRAFGPEHPQVASVLHGLGTMCKHQARYRDALPLLEQARAMREKLLGPSHPDVAATLNNIGTAEMGLGRYREALGHLEAALRIIEQRQGPDHVNVAITLNNVAAAQARLGKGAEAEANMLRAMEIAVKRYGPEHDLISTCHLNMALAQQALGEMGPAVASLEKSVAIVEKKLGKEHPGTFASLQALGGAQLRTGRPKDAAQTLERALRVVDQEAGAAKLAEARLDLAKALRSLGGSTARARELAMRAEEGFRDAERTPEAEAAAALARSLDLAAPPAR